jgi:glutamate 5-kinase
VLSDAVHGVAGVGTVFVPRSARLSARRLWIAFAVRSNGVVRVDAGAHRALAERDKSLLAAGVVGVEGEFSSGDAVEVAGPDGVVFAKGLVRHGAAALRAIAGKRTADIAPEQAHEVIHRDDLVVLP